MANSFVRYTGNGSTTAYAISYSYRAASDLIVTINGVATTSYTLNSAGSTLTFDTAPANASSIEIRRKTSQTSRLTDYAAGSVLTENDLDTDSTQAFFMGQEAIDDANDVISLDNSDFQYNVGNKRLKNVTDPTSAQDAVTKNYLENTWLSSANKTALTTVASNISSINTVNSNSTNINSAVSNATNINTVATNIGSVNTVATDITKVIAVANDLAEAVSEIETVADDLNEASSEIDVVAGAITNVNTVGGAIANVNTVAGMNSAIATVNANASNINSVAGISANVTSVAGNSTNINAVNSNSSNINTVAGNNSNINTVAGANSNITTLAGINANITTVAGISGNVTTVAGMSTAINTINSSATAINSVNANATNINAVAGDISNINTVAGANNNISTVVSNLASVNNFGEVYRVSSSAPSSSLNSGDLWFDSTNNILKVYGASGFQSAGSSINGTSARFKYVATANQTTFTGNDSAGNNLSFDATYVDVYLNGVHLDPTDYNGSSGSSIVLTSGANVGDILYIVGFGTFNISTVDAGNISSGTLSSSRLPSIPSANLPTVPTTKGGTGLTSLGTAGQVLKVNSGANGLEYGQASSAEVYGFNKNSSGQLIITTTNQGVDNISSATFATFDDVLFSASGFVFSISNGELISTI